MDGVEISAIDTALARGRQWLQNASVKTKVGYGWPEIGGEPDPEIWGGTLDGIIGLSSAGATEKDPYIAGGLRELRSYRASDRGWPIQETGWPLTDTAESVMEATAWVLNAFKAALGSTSQDPILKETADFLVENSCAQGGWGSVKGDTANMYSTALGLWALAGLNDDFVKLQISFVLNAINVDGGWGFQYMDNKSSVAMTGLVLFVLFTTRADLPEDKIAQAVSWLRTHQTQDGIWENEIDIRIIKAQTRYSYSRVRHFSSSWAIRAMLKAAYDGHTSNISPGINRLLSLQQPEGFWAYSVYDNTPWVWCTMNSICTLAEVRDSIIQANNKSGTLL